MLTLVLGMGRRISFGIKIGLINGKEKEEYVYLSSTIHVSVIHWLTPKTKCSTPTR